MFDNASILKPLVHRALRATLAITGAIPFVHKSCGRFRRCYAPLRLIQRASWGTRELGANLEKAATTLNQQTNPPLLPANFNHLFSKKQLKHIETRFFSPSKDRLLTFFFFKNFSFRTPGDGRRCGTLKILSPRRPASPPSSSAKIAVGKRDLESDHRI
jgi:hypothetical protein